MNESSVYKNLISHIDFNRSINSIENFNFNDIGKDSRCMEFLKDINTNNDAIELSLIKNNAYKEAVIIPLHVNSYDINTLLGIIRDEQKTFGGSKLFYLSESFDKMLIFSVSGQIEGKLNMVINRLNKVNEKIARLNSRIKKENLEAYMNKDSKDKKDLIVNMINKNFRV